MKPNIEKFGFHYSMPKESETLYLDARIKQLLKSFISWQVNWNFFVKHWNVQNTPHVIIKQKYCLR